MLFHAPYDINSPIYQQKNNKAATWNCLHLNTNYSCHLSPRVFGSWTQRMWWPDFAAQWMSRRHFPTFEVRHESRSMSRSHNSAMWVRFPHSKTITETISSVVSQWRSHAMDAKQYTYCNRSKRLFWRFISWWRANYSRKPISFTVSWFCASMNYSLTMIKSLLNPKTYWNINIYCTRDQI